MSIFSKLLLSLLCVISLAVAGWAASKELAAQSVLGRNWADRITLLVEMKEDVPTGLSARTIRNLVTACAEMHYRAPALRADAALRARFEATCGKIAQEVLRTAPTHARALAMALLMNPEFSAAALAKAQLAAPHEPWPLRMRIWALAESRAVTADLLKVADADFDRALNTRWGQRLLARLYLDREDMRPAILARAEARDTATQRAFLSAVTTEQRGGSALDFDRG